LGNILKFMKNFEIVSGDSRGWLLELESHLTQMEHLQSEELLLGKL
jgi:hypothetical protein